MTTTRRALVRAPRPTWVLCAAVLLCLSIAMSAAGTPDHGWWRLYFSRLGMTGDLSSGFFNGGLIVSGMIIAASAVPLRAVLTASATLTGRIPALLSLAVAGLGASLSGIGLFPLSVDPLAHDRATNGVVLSFAILLIVHRVGLWQVSRTLRIATLIVAPAILVGMGLLIVGWITLTVFEIVAFGAILAWVHLFERAVGVRPRGMRNNEVVWEGTGEQETEGEPCSKPTFSMSRSARRRVTCLPPIWSTSSCALRMIGTPGMTRAPSPTTSRRWPERIRSGSV
ncbi:MULTISPECIES: DUF998 domain-containing protein [unclassified Microbacterium]|uniref:DUF998 domain-containing protein n=1 Tax=unclassified Microbacterium TaxID=2609290 RepID=UPI0012FAB2CB|nr:DUF998 domain-containing protein [Microbacterium sp. MAH-37]MVQ43273.1 DUF998 domain-containing protein [Microbacterium sp. MAH-37]